MGVGRPSSEGHNKAHIHTIYPNFIEIGSAIREISSVQTDRQTETETETETDTQTVR